MMAAYCYKWSAFHLVKWLLIKGLLRGDLFKLGYAGLLSTIETGADGIRIKPYVKLYTKSAMRKQFGAFRVEDVSVHQLSLDHFIPAALCGPLRPRQMPFARVLGWYVTPTARKAL